MRLRLVGYSGVRPPVPGTEVVDPEDPGPTPDPPPDEIPPPLTLVLNNGDEFHKATYLALGYNRFDVMCIGAAGGHAGTAKQTIPDSGTHKQVAPLDYDLYWNAFRYIFGGAGGGGGVHRIKGRLALLPTNVPVVVGNAGADGENSEITSAFHDWRTGSIGYAAAPVPAAGGDGGASSFGGTICRASGGKGGVGVIGGAGGTGNAIGSGGGPSSAYTGTTHNPSTGEITPGVMTPGTWDGKIGKGGAGGRGVTLRALDGDFASGGAGIANEVRGADGAYSATDPSVSGPGAAGAGFGFDYTRITGEFSGGVGTGYNILVASHYDTASANPGAGGGATAFPLTGELAQYGSKVGGLDGKGAVIVRLTYAIV